MKRLMLSVTLLTLPFSISQAGGMQGVPAMMSTPMPNMPGMSMMGMQMQATMQDMMKPMMNDLARLSGRSFERAFLSMMIPHRQGAIDSSRVVLERATDPQVRAWAQEMITEQQNEILEMQRRLQPFGGPNTAMQQRMIAMNRMMNMPAVIRASRVPERTFLEGMIPHHAGANTMSNLALQRTQDPLVLELAERMMTSQGKQMHDFQEWLRTHAMQTS